ncbi:MAG: HD domain-containing phosphohydrolase [Candidatus Gastranaerophilaceae bacterium]|jgi:putative two-component system response regulator
MVQLDPLGKESYLENFHKVIAEKHKSLDKHTILIVDDEINNLQLLNRTLRGEYNILTASNRQEAFELIKENNAKISLIISDQRMPVMNGTELFTKIVDKYPNIIKMLLTGHSDMETLVESINECDLFQYILKPFDPDDLKIIVKNGIEIYDLTNSKKALLKELKELFYTTIKSIASALDAKDTYTHGHSMRVTLYSLILANQIETKTETFLEEIETAGLLHDIGKIGVPESILCKPGKLTDEEFEIMKSHPEQGKKMLNGIKKLNAVAEWLNTHHERWDGKGYPNRIKGDSIPLTARIIAIADTYDAMTSSRSYRKALSHEIAFSEIKNCAGSQFDPALVEIFVQNHEEFKLANEQPQEYYQKYSILKNYFTTVLEDLKF